MKTYRVDEHRIEKPVKLIVLPDGYQVTNNDGTIRIELRHMTVMDGSMENGSYYTKMWIREDNGWTEANNSQSYRSKEEFLGAIMESEDFTQAISEYKFNSKNNNEL